MGDYLELKISALSHDGRGIGFLNAYSSQERGKAIFVAGALPGQRVACRGFKDKGSYAEAVSAEIIHSPWPAESTCPHWRECGACPLLPMPYDEQMFWKEKLALDAMLRIGRMAGDFLRRIWRKPLPSPQSRCFRNKVELAFGENGGDLALGFRKRQSHAVFPLANCQILPDGAAEIIQAGQTLAKKSNLAAYAGRGAKNDFSGFWRFLILRKGLEPSTLKPTWGAICITSPGNRRQRKIVANLGRELLAMCPSLGNFVHEERKNRDFLPRGQKRVLCLNRDGKENPDAAVIIKSAGAQLFDLDMASFFQVNDGAANLLFQLAHDLDAALSKKGGCGLLDLYCGVGAPGQILASGYDRALGVEKDLKAGEYARKNAIRAGLGHYVFQAGDAGEVCSTLKKGDFFTVLLDPPRGGLNALTIREIMRIAPENIIYISCNPATMARDAAILDPVYEAASLGCVDLFPHTPHMECCGLWRRRDI